jgi:glycogen synthase
MALIHHKKIDLMYVEGTGDIVEALTRWYKQEDVLSETSKTFSGQVFDFCKKNALNTLAISAFNQHKQVNFDGFSAYSKPKRMFRGGIGYHLSQILYGLNILATAIRHRPTYLHITNGATHWFMLAPLKLLGIKIFPQFHNTFWAKGYPPTGKIQRLLLKLDAWFLKYIATGAICCSPEIQRQIAEMTHGKSCPTYVFKAQFYRASFSTPPEPKSLEEKPFTVIYAGRIERNKGVFDILKIAKKLHNQSVVFHICGDGEALSELIEECKTQELTEYVHIHGRLNRPDLIEIYTLGHVVIVPTRSDFAEGFAMVAAEAILLNRPIITSSIVPALESLNPAAVEAYPENVDSYVNAIQRLIVSKTLLKEKQLACEGLKEQFLDGNQGLANILEYSLSQ